MLSSIRKFSNSIAAKIFLAIIAIPVIFWGMGDVFASGSKKTLVKIGKEKISKQEFIKFLNIYTNSGVNINDETIEDLLSNFIGFKLISKEVESLDIVLTDISLKRIIKSEKNFTKNNIFSRVEYEKFLIKNSLNAVSFEKNILEQEKKNHLLSFVGNGFYPSEFLVAEDYNKINQKRYIQTINLNKAFVKDLEFSDKDIKKYFENNKENYKSILKSIDYIKLEPKVLTNTDEFTNMFFTKIDEIDDLIIEGNSLSEIAKKYNLPERSSLKIEKFSKNNIFSTEVIQNIFNINESEPIVLVQDKDLYFVINLIKTETTYKKYTSNLVKKDILNNLVKQKKMKLISKLIESINEKKFNKLDFDKLSNEKNVEISKFKINNLYDTEKLKQNIVLQIYSYPEKKIGIAADANVDEIYLLYVDKVTSAEIGKNDEDYEKYFNISKARLTKNVYATYDKYLKEKYKISINNKVLNSIKNELK